jgi:hypothetical protein
MNKHLAWLSLVLGLLLTGCLGPQRIVVIPQESIGEHQDPDWKILKEPAGSKAHGTL